MMFCGSPLGGVYERALTRTSNETKGALYKLHVTNQILELSATAEDYDQQLMQQEQLFHDAIRLANSIMTNVMT